jgi:lipid-binding SYLF domain-containing protein
VELFIDKENAEKRIRKVKSVDGVRNHIQIAGKQLSDAELRETLANKLRYDRVGYGIVFNNLTVGVENGAVTIGGQVRDYGRGVMTCRSARDFSGRWSAPSMMALEGGSFGLQLGGQATDFVLLVMNQRGAHSILTSQVKLGGDMAAAAGPKGRSAAASTDVTMQAEILSYSRSRGLFAGISLEGSTLRPDNDGNERLYGKGTPAKGIVINSAIRPPASAKLLLATLNKKSPRNESGK